jgi:hypothetical protein
MRPIMNIVTSHALPFQDSFRANLLALETRFGAAVTRGYCGPLCPHELATLIEILAGILWRRHGASYLEPIQALHN